MHEFADFFVHSPVKEGLEMEVAKFLVWMQARTKPRGVTPISLPSLVRALGRLPALYSQIHSINHELAQAARFNCDTAGWHGYMHSANMKKNALATYLQTIVGDSNPSSGTYWVAEKAQEDLRVVAEEIDEKIMTNLQLVTQARDLGSERTPLLTHSRRGCQDCIIC
jgi:hypothetical protein